jgi:hypothetical protein
VARRRWASQQLLMLSWALADSAKHHISGVPYWLTRSPPGTWAPQEAWKRRLGLGAAVQLRHARCAGVRVLKCDVVRLSRDACTKAAPPLLYNPVSSHASRCISQALYQLPWIDSPTGIECISSAPGVVSVNAGSSSCFSWQGLIGFRKLLVLPVVGWNGCPYAGAVPIGDQTCPSIATSATCASPFSFWLGVMPSVVFFVLIALQVR